MPNCPECGQNGEELIAYAAELRATLEEVQNRLFCEFHVRYCDACPECRSLAQVDVAIALTPPEALARLVERGTTDPQ